MRHLAAERGRTRPLGFTVRANVVLSENPFEEEGRQPFQGNVKQIVEDLLAHAEIDGLQEILLDLSGTTRDGDHLLGVLRDVYAAARSAGV